MPNEQDPDRVPEGRRPRLVRYKSMIKVRMERESFAHLFTAARLAGAPSTSAWIRRVLRQEAVREFGRHRGHQHPPG